MTDKEMIELAAKAAGIELIWGVLNPQVPLNAETTFRWNPISNFDLKAFAALVAAAEREACAKLCENGINAKQYPTLLGAGGEMAAAIRERSAPNKD